MNDFRYRLARFMYGRYGVDPLYYALFVFYIVLAIANTFLRLTAISWLEWAVLIFMAYRVFSRNIVRRRWENEQFLRVWAPVREKSARTVRRVRDFRTHRYRRCPSCKAILRLPRRTGKRVAQCPRCGHEFTVHIRF
jgi:predicted RNA-binding Zn-ribbon protein involved in translation (DUF1610 family)